MAGSSRSQVPREPRRQATRMSAKTRIPQAHDKGEGGNGMAARPRGSLRYQSPGAPGAGLKRKDREHETPSSVGSPVVGSPVTDTNIRVLVRCRGRNDREMKENSPVALATNGVKGSTVEVTMGPNAVSNKTYEFDKVFSAAADQAIVFDEAVSPILDEMLGGFNCTIFAYGQTGTGKTYTMTGDMTDTLGLLSDDAGIIPRVLYALFQRLADREFTVKCSFLELYNEELRDLLSTEEGTKLKIYEDGAKRGYQGTMVQGMGETFIHSASEGIKLLKYGSDKRHVAATKCNDLSSRSHTIFTITVFIKRTNDKGEESVSSGKLNLVDLAGSENIQRSGAEHKRAAEAGLINKSLLTLGRVINSLVDRNAHIPYRESKLTRLLQDSLGGHTKTCIIATVSPARSNLEETISTLDYAFRAKNIRNKPQINSTISKKTLLREWSIDLEKLKSELIATRQRNGVYLPTHTYEEMTLESQSRKIETQELRARLETMETNMKHKSQELLTITSNFHSLKQNNEAIKAKLEVAEEDLRKAETTLTETQRHVEEEVIVRKAHEATEDQLYDIGTDLVSTIEKYVSDIAALHDTIQRRADLHDLNRDKWDSSNAYIRDVADKLDHTVSNFQEDHEKHLSDLSDKMQSFVAEEQQNLQDGEMIIQQMEASFDTIQEEARRRLSQDRDTMDGVLGEINLIRDDIRQKVSECMSHTTSEIRTVLREVGNELQELQDKMHSTYHNVGVDLVTLFTYFNKFITSQKEEVDRLRKELQDANEKALKAEEAAAAKLEEALEEERRQSECEREEVIAQISSLFNGLGERQASRLKERVQKVQSEMDASRSAIREAGKKFTEDMNEWADDQDEFLTSSMECKEAWENRMEKDLIVLKSMNDGIISRTNDADNEVVARATLEQKRVDQPLGSLDSFVSRAQALNDRHRRTIIESIDNFATNSAQGQVARQRLQKARTVSKGLNDHFQKGNNALRQVSRAVLGSLKGPLGDVLSRTNEVVMDDYKPTGETPRRPMGSEMPISLPRTAPRDRLLGRSTSPPSPLKIPTPIGGRKRLREPDSHFCSPPAPVRLPSSPPVPVIPAQYADLVPPPSKRRASGVRPTGLPAPAKSGRRRRGGV